MFFGLEVVSGNGFVGVLLYGIRIVDWVSVFIGGIDVNLLESVV